MPVATDVNFPVDEQYCATGVLALTYLRDCNCPVIVIFDPETTYEYGVVYPFGGVGTLLSSLPNATVVRAVGYEPFAAAYDSAALAIPEMSDKTSVSLPCFILSAGFITVISPTARIPITAITTRSSMRVKPLRELRIKNLDLRIRNFFIYIQ